MSNNRVCSVSLSENSDWALKAACDVTMNVSLKTVPQLLVAWREHLTSISNNVESS